MTTQESFQTRVKAWMTACFGEKISADKIERNHRFLEEAIELVQSNGCTQAEAHLLVDYVYGRDVGEINQEVGGVMVTLAAFCLANGIDMHEGGETELARVWTKVEQIRAKQAAKPKYSPLPEHVDSKPYTDICSLPECDITFPCRHTPAKDNGFYCCKDHLERHKKLGPYAETGEEA